MGRYSQRKHEEANDALINAVDSDSNFDSLKEILTMLSDEDGKKTFAQLVAVEIEKALGENGTITTAITNAISAAFNTALGEGGDITTAISGAITAALGENGDITTAISGAITTAIGENGAIETWGDGRYTKKEE